MTTNLTYEVECQLDPDIVADYDAWLPGHVREVLACAGFLGADIEAPEAPAGGRQRRRVRYRIESSAALERYLEHDAPRLRAEATRRYGTRLHCERRVLRPRQALAAPAREPARCLNCGTVVGGRYCAQCGQAGDVHVVSIREVAGDVTHSLLHLDSRVWRTLRLLVRKPGELTREFIAGRHQMYIPPFRLYLAVSILYFALSALLPESGLFDLDAPGAAGGDPQESIDGALQDVDGCQVRISGDTPNSTELERVLSRACENIKRDGGRHFAERFASTAPKLMFVFLPLMAAAAMLFYWRPRRLYAEHLVLFLHNHAFMFLLLAVAAILNQVARLQLPLAGMINLVVFLMWCWLPYYVYRSMRVVYAEGRARTLLKLFTLATIYFLLLGITLLTGLMVAALQLS